MALFHPLFSSLTTTGLNNQAITNPIKNGVATLRIVITNFRIPHSFINKVAKEKGLQAFQVLPKCQTETRTKEDVKNRIEDCIFPGVTTWLRAFMDAEMTIVDSFHGMVFSIIFNKPFWVIGNANRGMSRFTSLLKVFHLEERLLDANQLHKVDINRPIDWASVNAILEQKRNECINLLLTELSK